jgi:hypothetical protein
VLPSIQCFQLPLARFIPLFNVDSQFTDTVKFESKDTLRAGILNERSQKSVIRNMELLVIDEVSMLRADLLDAMDYMMQTVRKGRLCAYCILRFTAITTRN